MAHIHDVFNTDERFTIDPDSRLISQRSGKTKLMLNDHNSECYAFEMPRYIDGHDMSLCTDVTVHYINLASNKVNKSIGPYEVKDFQIDPANEEQVIFSWTISRGCTTYPGNLSFIIEFECLTNDVIDYAWHTDIFKGITIGDGIHNDEVLNQEYFDILTQWKNDILSEIPECKVQTVNGVAPDEKGNVQLDLEQTIFSFLIDIGVAPVLLDSDGAVLVDGDNSVLLID